MTYDLAAEEAHEHAEDERRAVRLARVLAALLLQHAQRREQHLRVPAAETTRRRIFARQPRQQAETTVITRRPHQRSGIGVPSHNDAA